MRGQTSTWNERNSRSRGSLSRLRDTNPWLKRPSDELDQSTKMSESIVSRRMEPPGARRRKLPTRCKEIVAFVFEHRRATAAQLRRRFFRPGAASRMRHWLAVLRRERYLEHCARRSLSEPAICKIGGRSYRGLSLLRGMHGDAAVRRRLAAYVQDEHFALITECYVAIWEAVGAAGWELRSWEDAIDLRPRTARDGIVPDAHFCIGRPDGSRAAFFLEVERTAKSELSLRRKLEQHRRFFRSGRYEEIFESRSLRVLFVLAASERTRIDPANRLCEMAERLGASFVCATTVNNVKSATGKELLFSAVWHRAGRQGRYALFA